MSLSTYLRNLRPAASPTDLLTSSKPARKQAARISRVYVVLDGHFSLKDGKPASCVMDYEFFSRYLKSFEQVIVVARLFGREEDFTSLVEGPNVSFLALPDYKGAIQSLFAIPKLFWILYQVRRDSNGTVILRLPSTAGIVSGYIMAISGKPFGLDLIGDPAHAYSKESLKHPLGRLFQWLFTSSCRYLCKQAKTASYVTKETLQSDYPAGKHTQVFNFTSLDLHPSDFSKQSRTAEDFERNKNSPRLVQVAMMPNWSKGHDISLKMIADFKKRGKKVHLRLIGDGQLRPELEDMAKRLDIAELVTFVGQVKSGECVRSEIDKADMLILPSRQEGLPRVVIEAMARGVPCVANKIGGTAELLDGDQMVDDLSVEAFLHKVETNLADIPLLVEQSARNLSVAKTYGYAQVQKQRDASYRTLKCA